MASPPVSSFSTGPTPLGSDGSDDTCGLVLLNKDCYVAKLPNDTTVVGTTSTGLPVEVTFHAARPPAASRVCVHCPGLDLYRRTPKVLATDADLLLLCINVCPEGMLNTHGCDHFVYRPGVGRLDLLPNPYPRYLKNEATALISRDGGSSYAVASLGVIKPVMNGEVIISWNFDLHLYIPESGRWTTMILPVADLRRDELAPLPDALDGRLYHETDKTITIGGARGTVAWVDLWRGIFFCDVLAECPVLDEVLLPGPSWSKWVIYFGKHDPRYIRDVTIHRDNSIKYIEMEIESPRVQSRFQASHYNWKATIWSMPLPMGSSSAWQRYCEVDANDIIINSRGPCISTLLSMLSGSSTGGMLQELSLSYPTISMDGSVVYFRSWSGWLNKTEMLSAIDMRKRTLQAVDMLDFQKNVIIRTFCTSEICRYLGSGMRGALKRIENVAVKHKTLESSAEEAF